MIRRIPLSRCKRCPHYNGHICDLPDLYPCVEEHNFRIKNRFLAVATIVASILIALCLLCSCGQAPDSEPPKHWSAVELLRNQHKNELTEWDKLILAIALTESRFNADALGKAGDSGILQLREIYIDEVNRLYGTDYTIDDAFDIDKSLAIFHALQAHYNPAKDISKGIYYHNKSASYKRVVMENYELICRAEEVRAKLVNNEKEK